MQTFTAEADYDEIHIERTESDSLHYPGSSTTWCVFVPSPKVSRIPSFRAAAAANELGHHAIVLATPQVADLPSWRSLEAAVRFARRHGADDTPLMRIDVRRAALLSISRHPAFLDRDFAKLIEVRSAPVRGGCYTQALRDLISSAPGGGAA